jgi:DNA polymerase (family 10)
MTDRRAVADALGRLAFALELLEPLGPLGPLGPLEDPAKPVGPASAARDKGAGPVPAERRLDPAAVTSLAWALRSADHDIVARWRDGGLQRFEGMTTPLYALIDDVLSGRPSPLLARLEADVPPGLLEIRGIKGLGPKKVRALWKELEITSLGELEYACNENRLVELKGFGKKTQEAVLAGIAEIRGRAGLMRLDRALALALPLVEALRRQGALGELAGDARRRKELVAEVKIVTSASIEVAANIKAAAGPKAERVVVVSVPIGGFAWKLAEETGSPEHVEALRTRARRLSIDVETLAVEAVAPEPVAGSRADEPVYEALGLSFTPPERREPGVPLVEKGQARPRLVERRDLTGALHNHTTASDGTATLAEMAAAAAARGLRWLGISDHSHTANYAHGLDAGRLLAQRDEIEAHNRRIRVARGVDGGTDPGPDGGAPVGEPGDVDGEGACVLLHGVESDILADGALDHPDDVLERLDVVIASVHHRHGQQGDVFAARMARAASHPLTDVIGHPTGRLLLSRAPVEYDVSKLLEACASAGCAVELNANPARLDLAERWLAEAKERGVMISIAADAHSTGALDHLDYGVAIARRAGLTPEDVLNARPLVDVLAWLKARRRRRQTEESGAAA